MLSTAEAAEEIGVCKNTLLRWVTEGLMEDVEKDWRGWRTWSRADVDRGKAFRRMYHSQTITRRRRKPTTRASLGGQVAESMSRYGLARGLWKRGT
jgi:hypothetical protein